MFAVQAVWLFIALNFAGQVFSGMLLRMIFAWVSITESKEAMLPLQSTGMKSIVREGAMVDEVVLDVVVDWIVVDDDVTTVVDVVLVVGGVCPQSSIPMIYGEPVHMIFETPEDMG
jgi:hypothetical protein